MSIATKPAERIPLAPVQRRIENHVDLRIERQAETHENAVDLLIIGRESAADADESRRERIKFAALKAVLLDTYASPAMRLIAAEQYRSFWITADNAEDAIREQREGSALRRLENGIRADQMHHDYLPACTGERPLSDGCFGKEGRSA